MADYRLRMDDTLSIDTSYNGAGADVGITYAIAAGFENMASINAANGTFVPAAPGLVVVEIKDSATNAMLKRLAIEIVANAEATLEEALAAGDETLAVTFTSTYGSMPV